MNTYTITQSAKKDRIIYWVSTILIVAFEGVGALWFNSPLAIEGTRHLGFPDYFRVELSLGKIIGSVLLILPMVPARFKEWAYVGFGISMISAIIANFIVDGPAQASLPFIGLVILTVSYVYYHRVKG